MTQQDKAPNPADTAVPMARRARGAMPQALIGALLGLVLFACLAGVQVLMPSNITWLLDSPDPTTHYLGWAFFRHDHWRLPLGLNPNYGLASGSSIIYSDSIPLLALLLKPFTAWLGEPFQYTGIWLLLCFVLQGIFAMMVCGRFVHRRLSQVLAAGLLMIPFIFLKRLDGHYALAGQWTLLWALYLYFRRPGDPSGPIVRLIWALLACLAVLIHLYLAVLVLAIWSADLLRRFLADRRMLRRGSIEVAVVVATLLSTMWVAGYFCLGVSDMRTPNSTGAYSMNLLSPIDSRGFSRFLPAFPLNRPGQVEGVAYLGLGIMGMAIATLLVVWVRRRLRKSPDVSSGVAVPVAWAPLLLVCALLLLFAISPIITYGSTRLLTLPNYWDGIGEVLRATGRMSWPAVYVLPLLLLAVLSAHVPGRTLALLLAAVLLVQIIDLSPMLQKTHQHFRDPQPSIRKLSDRFWSSDATRYRQIILVPNDDPETDWQPLAFYAADHGMAINHGYFARMDWNAKEAANATVLSDLAHGKLDAQSLYILCTPETVRTVQRALPQNAKTIQADGYTIVVP